MADELSDPESHAHPTERQYVKVAFILAVLTAIEVAIFYIAGLRGLLRPLLGVLMLAKFMYVAGYFMHLKFDSRIFRGLFVIGIILALAVFAIALWTFSYTVRDTGASAFGPLLT
jgi:cytochrome c oxidase subunit IV